LNNQAKNNLAGIVRMDDMSLTQELCTGAMASY